MPQPNTFLELLLGSLTGLNKGLPSIIVLGDTHYGAKGAEFIAEDGDLTNVRKGVSEPAMTLAEMAKNFEREPEPFPADPGNGFVLKLNDIHIIHNSNPKKRNSGITVAWRYPKGFNGKLEDRAVIEVATALVHPNDVFDKKVGTRIAANNMLDGKYITLPLIKGQHPTDMLKLYFSTLVD